MVQRSRTPLILLVMVLSLCIAFACVVAAGGLVVYRILGVPQPSRSLLTSTGEPAPVGSAAIVTPSTVPAVNRLVVVGGDGNIYTVRPDGTDRIGLTADASARHIYQQPTWSPMADLVAWTEVVDVEAVMANTSVMIAGIDGQSPARSDMAGFAPFYLAWSPDGAWLACLSSWPDGLALRTVDPAAPDGQPQVIEQGQPLYFSWSPDGARLFAHVSGDRLALLSAGGDEEVLDPHPGVFGAPGWTGDGTHLVFVERQGSAQRVNSRQRLVLAGLDGDVERELAVVEGALTFALSSDGARVAFVDTTVEMAMAAFGPLRVVDVESGQTERISAAPVLAFFWSPDGEKLAYLTLGEGPGDGPRASAVPLNAVSHLDIWLQWHVWDGDESFELVRFSPADTYLVDHLRFFDQYARSMTPWSPDSEAFTFAGMTDDGALGIWVQEARPQGALIRAGDGVYSAWSPR
jgi:TolB protein